MNREDPDISFIRFVYTKELLSIGITVSKVSDNFNPPTSCAQANWLYPEEELPPHPCEPVGITRLGRQLFKGTSTYKETRTEYYFSINNTLIGFYGFPISITDVPFEDSSLAQFVDSFVLIDKSTISKME